MGCGWVKVWDGGGAAVGRRRAGAGLRYWRGLARDAGAPSRANERMRTPQLTTEEVRAQGDIAAPPAPHGARHLLAGVFHSWSWRRRSCDWRPASHHFKGDTARDWEPAE